MSDLPDYLVDQLIKVLIRRDYVDRRDVLKNDENPITPNPPSYSLTAVPYKGKFFPRGTRGLIESISVYCKRTIPATLKLSLAPFPGLGPVATLTITPSLYWGWASVNYREMWNYDSLFIWVSGIEVGVSYGYDTLGSPDAYSSGSEQKVWAAENRRYAIRIDGKGFTPGDIPVSGTINTIEIPVVSSGASQAWVTVPASESVSLITLRGAGQLEHVLFVSDYEGMYFLIFCDDGIAAWFSWAHLNTYGITAATPELQKLTGPDPEGNYYTGCNTKLKWKRILEVMAYNSHLSTNYRASIHRLTYTKI